MRATLVVDVDELVEQCLQLDDGGRDGVGGEPAFECLVEAFDLAAGRGMVLPAVLLDDAEAAALGEWVLRGAIDEALVFVGVGTGIGGAVIDRGAVTHGNLFGHQGGFGSKPCSCGRVGCLETVAAGWALPESLDEVTIDSAARAIAAAIRAEPAAACGVVVVAGGIAALYPALTDGIAAALPERTVVASSRRAGAKSAAGWGVRRLLERQAFELVQHDVDVRIVADAAAAAVEAADVIERAVVNRPDLNLGVATGSTPMATYAELGRRGIDFSRAAIWLRDEYLGVGPDEPQSYRSRVCTVLGEHLGIAASQVHGPDSSPSPGVDGDDAAVAALRCYDEAIAAAGGMDLQILGIGRNGHIGFNEPGSPFDRPTRIVALTEATRQDNARFFDSVDDVPRRAITQGIGTILESRQLLLIATGAVKAETLRAALTGPIDPVTPASAIRLHPAAVVVADREAAAGLGGRTDRSVSAP